MYTSGFTTKVKVTIDEEVELGNQNPLDDYEESTVEPNLYVNPNKTEEEGPSDDDKPLASYGITII